MQRQVNLTGGGAAGGPQTQKSTKQHFSGLTKLFSHLTC
jgi:hypothetical protein